MGGRPTRRAALALVAGVLAACSPSGTAGTGAEPAGADGSASPAADAEVAARSEDLDLLADALGTRPASLGDTPARDEIEARLAPLRDRLGELTDDEFAVDVMRTVVEHALVQDGHSGVFPLAQDWHLAPVQLYTFTDGWFVVRASDPELVGQQVTAIDDHDVETVTRLLSPLVPADGEATIRARLPQFAVTREVLTGVGIAPVSSSEHDDGRPPPVTFTFADGARVAIDVVPAQEYAEILPEPIPLIPPALPPVGQAAKLAAEGAFGITHLEDPAALLATYDRVLRSSGGTTVRTFADELRTAAEALAPDAPVVLDLRRNPGGDVGTARPLVDAVDAIATQRPVRVLVSRSTFSAASLVAVQLRAVGATLWGEPTGGGPNAIGTPREVRLPASGLVIHLGTRRAIGVDPEDPAGTVVPDQALDVTPSDHFADRDPVLERARAG